MNEPMTAKQKMAVDRIRERVGDSTLLDFVCRGKWENHVFDFENLSKEEAQHIIICAPHKPILGVYGRDFY